MLSGRGILSHISDSDSDAVAKIKFENTIAKARKWNSDAAFREDE